MTKASSVGLLGVDVRYGSVVAVRGVDLTLAPGEIHALLGASGSGKTTLLRAIAGFEKISAGQVTLGGRVVDDAALRSPPLPPEARRVGVVFQDYALFPHLDVHHNVAFGAQNPAGIDALLDRVGLLELAQRFPGELSGGQQQRVALARALAQDPTVLLLDEPFAHIDLTLRRALRAETLRLLREAGRTALFVTHDVTEAFTVGDRASVIHEGRLLQTDTPAGLYQAPVDEVVGRAVGEACLLPGETAAGGEAVDCVLGRLPLRRPATTGRVLLRPEQLTFVAAGDGVPARVEERWFLGADVELRLRLDGGQAVTARIRAAAAPATEEVWVRCQGPVVRVGGAKRPPAVYPPPPSQSA